MKPRYGVSDNSVPFSPKQLNMYYIFTPPPTPSTHYCDLKQVCVTQVDRPTYTNKRVLMPTNKYFYSNLVSEVGLYQMQSKMEVKLVRYSTIFKRKPTDVLSGTKTHGK